MQSFYNRFIKLHGSLNISHCYYSFCTIFISFKHQQRMCICRNRTMCYSGAFVCMHKVGQVRIPHLWVCGESASDIMQIMEFIVLHWLVFALNQRIKNRIMRIGAWIYCCMFQMRCDSLSFMRLLTPLCLCLHHTFSPFIFKSLLFTCVGVFHCCHKLYSWIIWHKSGKFATSVDPSTVQIILQLYCYRVLW